MLSIPLSARPPHAQAARLLPGATLLDGRLVDGSHHPRQVDGGDAWGTVGPLGVARLVGELCDVAELLVAERAGVRGGRDTGQ